MGQPLFYRSRRSANRSVLKLALAILWAAALFSSCGGPLFYQPGHEISHVHSRGFYTDYNTAWQASLEALKRFEKTVQNRQGGVIQTAWLDNTAEKNFIEGFGGDATYVKAQYRLNLSVAPGSYNGRAYVKVSVRKEQVIQRDLLEGWKPISSDAIEENAFLYRIGRIILMKTKLKQIEERKMQQVMDEGI